MRCLAPVLLLLAFATFTNVSSQGIKTGTILPKRPQPNIAVYELNITLGRGAPACGKQRDVILVNGLFMPTLTGYINDTFVITVNNRLPAYFPQTSSGISLHWHGLGMWDNSTWHDGTSYVTQCPIQAGHSYTYEFLVDDAPGTYFWHDHSTVNRANGLTGALILELRPGSRIRSPFKFSGGDRVVMVADWWDDEANAMAMRLNRPYDPSATTPDSGAYVGVRRPDALLINGKGNAGDCDLTKTVSGVKQTYNPPVCEVTDLAIPSQPGFSGCRHAEFTVTEGKQHLFRIINAVASTYITVCFEGHSIDVMFADATPVDLHTFDNGCVDLASGQRYDVALTAKPLPSHAGQRVFWVSVHSQYRAASPSAYAILRYAGASTGTLPPTPTPPNNVEPWYLESQVIKTHEGVIGYLDNYDYNEYYQLFAHRGLYGAATVNARIRGDKTVILNMTMPLMKDTGQIRWAMNNIAMPTSSPCTPILKDIYDDPDWLTKNTVNPTPEDRAAATQAILGVQTFDKGTQPKVFDATQPAPIIPAAGMHVVKIEWDDIVDVIMVNQPASANNGDHRNVTRAFMDHHPMHLHGHKFFVIGQGYGTFDPATDWDKVYLNFHNPMLRDTATLPPGGWLFIRFLANNPGAWPMHCHLMWHAYMGQMLYFLEALDRVPPPPAVMARCPDKCLASFAPYTRSWINATFPNSTFQMP